MFWYNYHYSFALCSIIFFSELIIFKKYKPCFNINYLKGSKSYTIYRSPGKNKNDKNNLFKSVVLRFSENKCWHWPTLTNWPLRYKTYPNIQNIENTENLLLSYSFLVAWACYFVSRLVWITLFCQSIDVKRLKGFKHLFNDLFLHKNPFKWNNMYFTFTDTFWT